MPKSVVIRYLPDWIQPIKWRTHRLRATGIAPAINDFLYALMPLRTRDAADSVNFDAVDVSFSLAVIRLGGFDELWLKHDAQAVFTFIDQTIHWLQPTELQVFCLWALRTLYIAKTSTSLFGTTDVESIDLAMVLKLATYAKQKLTTSRRRTIGKVSGGLRNPTEKERKRHITAKIKTWVAGAPDLRNLDPRDDVEVLSVRLRSYFTQELGDGEATEQEILSLTRKEILYKK